MFQLTFGWTRSPARSQAYTSPSCTQCPGRFEVRRLKIVGIVGGLRIVGDLGERLAVVAPAALERARLQVEHDDAAVEIWQQHGAAGCQ